MNFDKFWKVLIIASFVLGLAVGVYTVVLAKQQSDQLAASSCSGSKAALEQWTATLDEVGHQLDSVRPGASDSASFTEFRKNTTDRYEKRVESVCSIAEDN